jgi:diguanylate cyclase
MAEGMDPEIDNLLGSIREAIRSGAPGSQLIRVSDDLARRMLTATGRCADSEPRLPASHDVSGIGRLIKTMPLEPEAQTRMTELVRDIAGGHSTAERQRALGALLATASAALRDMAANDGSAKRGLFRRRGREGESERFVRLFVSLLGRLFEHIDVMNGHGLRSNELRDGLERIEQANEAETLLRGVTREIDAIDARIREERVQATDFLGTLRDRLDGFEQVMAEVSLHGERSVERSEALQTHVGDDVSDIDTAVRTGDALAAGHLIEASLAKITSRLAEHVLEEREQYARARQRVDDLTARLSALEQEADSLRNEIRDKSDLALKDVLTGVYNRAGYEERAREFYARWRRSGSDLAVVFIDCNRFKEINDTYGHGAGDLVLSKVAEILSGRARATDVVCRYGGDEFVVLLPDTDRRGAEVFARNVCDEVGEAGFNDNGRPIEVSISCGVTQLLGSDSLDDAMGRADEAMYLAKKAGGGGRVACLP